MRLSRLGVAVVAATCALAACTPSAPTADKEEGGGKMTTLNLWMPPLADDKQDKAMWNEFLAPFSKEHGVKIEVTIVPWDNYETKYLTGVTSGNGPDVGYMYQEIIGDYTTRDLLVPFDDHLTPQQRDNLLFLDRGVFDGKQYSVPFVVGAARIFVYNKEALAKAGVQPPKTWDEFLATCKPLADAGYTPYAAGWGDPNKGSMNSLFFPYVWQAGGQLFSPDGKDVLFDSPEVIRAATFVKDMQDAGCFGANATGVDGATASQLFVDGKSAYTVASEVDIPKYANLDYGFALSLQDKQQGTFIALDSLVVLKQCQDPKLCAALVDFMTQGPQMEKFHAKAHFPPIGKDEKSSFSPEVLEYYTSQSAALHPLPVVPKGVGAYAALHKNLQQMLNGEKSPEQAMQDAATEGRQVLK